jgi:hypothetical protein
MSGSTNSAQELLEVPSELTRECVGLCGIGKAPCNVIMAILIAAPGRECVVMLQVLPSQANEKVISTRVRAFALPLSALGSCAVCDKVSKSCRTFSALRRRQVEPHICADLVLRDAQAVVIKYRQFVLRVSVALLGQRTNKLHCGRVVASLNRSVSILQRACASGCCKAQHP